MTEIILTHECERCGTVIKNKILNLTDNEFLLTSFGQTTFKCPSCEFKHYVGDIEIYTEDEV